MIKESKKFTDIMKELYESKRITTKLNYSFKEMMESNKSRLMFLNELFNDIEVGNLSEECQELFKRNITFIKSFLNGDFKRNISNYLTNHKSISFDLFLLSVKQFNTLS